MNKSKIIMAVTIGIMSFMMIYVMLIQINIVNDDDREELEVMRDTELRELLASYKEKYEDADKQLVDTRAKIEEYKKDDKSEEDAVALLEGEVNQANMLLGKTNVKGEGIVITMDDNIRYDEQESRIVESLDLVYLINELKFAGAEAISINDQRIVSTSNLFNINNLININTQGTQRTIRIAAPYVIKAIGDKKNLEAALTIKGGFIYNYLLDDYIVNVEAEDEIFINKYEGDLSLNYVKKKEAK